MADELNDVFSPKPGRIRSLGGARAKSYINRVLHEISAIGKGSFKTGNFSPAFTG